MNNLPKPIRFIKAVGLALRTPLLVSLGANAILAIMFGATWIIGFLGSLCGLSFTSNERYPIMTLGAAIIACIYTMSLFGYGLYKTVSLLINLWRNA